MEIVTTLALSAVGITAVTAGIVGFWSRKLGPLARATFVVGGLLALPLGFVTFDELMHLPAAIVVVGFATALIVMQSRSIDGKTVA
jgi:hypothetical protein